MSFCREGDAVYTMIPAVQYNGNIRMTEIFQTIHEESPGIDKAKAHKAPTYFAGDRDENGEPHIVPYRCSSIPGGTYSEGKETAFAMFLPTDCMFGSCKLYKTDEGTMHTALWPEQAGNHRFRAGEDKWIDHFRMPGEKRTLFRTMMVFTAVERPRTAWHKLLDAVWDQNYRLCAPQYNQDEIWDMGIDYTRLLYTEEADGFRGFSIGFDWYGKWEKRKHQKYEIGWCGQNASMAVSLQTNALKTGNESDKQMGLNVLDSWVAATKPTGLIPTHYDHNFYTNGFDKTVDACNLGTAAVQLFQAQDLAEQLGDPRPSYGAAATAICDFAMKVMKPDGFIGKSWLEKDLSPAVQIGSTGAFLTWALAVCASRTGNAETLAAAERSMRYYANELREYGCTGGGALDIFTIDKESCIPILKAALVLHKTTGNGEYLDLAVDAAYYLSTWQWHYNRPYTPGSMNDLLHYRPFGGTAVSIHGGIDFYALYYVNELIELAELTGNPMWTQRAAAIWRHGQQVISDGTLVVDGKDPRPRGSQDEGGGSAFGQHADCLSQWLVAWPNAFRLETLRRWQTEDVHHYSRVL